MTHAYRFSVIPAGAITDARLEPRDLQVLCLLGRHTNDNGWCWRSQVKMAKEIRCGRASVQRSIERLCDAGWVQKKLRGREGAEPDPEKQPFAPYAYRVCLDNDAANEAVSDVESRDEAAEPSTEVPTGEQGVPTSGHGGAQPYVGTGCPDMRGHHKPSPEDSLQEPKRETRAREVKDRFDEFVSKYPTGALDDRTRTRNAWVGLSREKQARAIERIAAYAEHAKKHGRKHLPPAYRYLSDEAFDLIEAPSTGPAAVAAPPTVEGSAEWRAWHVHYRCCGALGIPGFLISGESGKRVARMPSQWPPIGRGPFPPEDAWVTIPSIPERRQQFAAWCQRLGEVPNIFRGPKSEFHDGKPTPTLRVPWDWPPRKDGSHGPPAESTTSIDE